MAIVNFREITFAVAKGVAVPPQPEMEKAFLR